MEVILILVVAFLASLLTFFSGFGLGTLLLPVFALFFPLEVAIALTAVVHMLNNLFKTGLMRRFIDWKMALWFGGFGIAGALLGAFALDYLDQISLIREGVWMGMAYSLTPLGLTVGVLLVIFALFDFFPHWLRFPSHRMALTAGGMLSGFFGGLSGHQGALRTAFLIKLNLSKEVFIGTGIIIAVCIDAGRLVYYWTSGLLEFSKVELPFLLAGTLAAFLGALLGKRYLKKVTYASLRFMIGIFLVLMGLAIGLGLV